VITHQPSGGNPVGGSAFNASAYALSSPALGPKCNTVKPRFCRPCA